MATTIGTNIVQDGSEVYELFQSIKRMLDQMYDHKKKSHYAEMLEELGKYVSQGGQTDFKLVPKKFVEAIEEKLDEQGICYTKMPDSNGNVAYIVKEEDAQAFLDIQANVFAVSSDYAMTTDMESILNTSRSNIVTLDFQGEDADLLTLMAQQKLYQCGIVSCSPDYDGRTFVNDASLFDKNGIGDLTDFEMKYALEQAMESEIVQQACGGVNILNVRLCEAQWDRDNIDAFIDSTENSTLVNTDNPKKASLYLSHEGKKFYKNERVNGGWQKTEIEFASREELKARITYMQDDIYSMAAVPQGVMDSLNKGEIDHLPARYCQRSKFIDKACEGRGTNAKVIREYSGKAIDATLMRQVSHRALEIMSEKNLNRLTQEEKYQMKHQIVASLLKNPEEPAVAAFLAEPLTDKAGNVVMSKEQKKQWLAEITQRFEDTTAREKNGVIIDKVTHAEMERLIEENKDRENGGPSMDAGFGNNGPDDHTDHETNGRNR